MCLMRFGALLRGEILRLQRAGTGAFLQTDAGAAGLRPLDENGTSHSAGHGAGNAACTGELLQAPRYLLGSAEYQLIARLSLGRIYRVDWQCQDTCGRGAGGGDTEGGEKLDYVNDPAILVQISQIERDL
jgi:hypothetical protein